MDKQPNTGRDSGLLDRQDQTAIYRPVTRQQVISKHELDTIKHLKGPPQHVATTPSPHQQSQSREDHSHYGFTSPT